ncbi:hypothetical protein [Sphingobacterium sp. LRF_L2]|uniref:hypothetical protein n=1 Tax=Sphingobacterium sp. LRF_L2 TaxID=3369421 RepID=UPI003F5D5C9E
MQKKTKNWLRTGSAIMALAFCTFLGSKALESKVEVPAAKALATQTWYFTGTSSDNLNAATNYSPNPVSGKPCGSTAQVVCRIEAPADPSNSSLPDMEAEDDNGTTIAQHINNAQSSLSANDVVKAFRSN